MIRSSISCIGYYVVKRVLLCAVTLPVVSIVRQRVIGK
jgi:hypothetical protein